jgi:hypothetical protein
MSHSSNARLDVLLVLSSILLILFGVLAVYSAIQVVSPSKSPLTFQIPPGKLPDSMDANGGDTLTVTMPVEAVRASDVNGFVGLAISVLGVSIGLAVFIPYLLSRSQIRDTLRPIAEEQYESLWNQTEKQILDLQRLDAHASRMIGWVLVQDRQATVWGIGWLARSCKKYLKVIEDKSSYDELLFLTFKKMIEGIDELSRIDKTDLFKRGWYSEDNLTRDSTISRLIGERLRVNEEKEPFQPSVRACKDLIDVSTHMEAAKLYRSDFFDQRLLKNFEDAFRGATSVLLHVLLREDRRFREEGGRQKLKDAVSVNAASDNVAEQVENLLNKEFHRACEDLRASVHLARQAS